ncbi:MAG: PQQ-binding-like beta-propeller repeat protein, partial [Verrucomicrobiota bacterium]|nr:PQQ-binding-like beta-propeller repeat protein [Verrucomicrobiota bacterium]
MNEKTPDPSPKVGNPSDAPAANAAASPHRKTGFPWFPAITVALVAAGIAAVQWRPELERNLRAWATAALSLLGILLLLVWFLASSRFRARTRLVGLALVVLCVLALKGSLRVDGTINGTGLPRLVWRGIHSGTVPSAAPPTETARNPVHAAALPGLEDSAQFLGPDRSGVLPVARFSTNWSAQAPRELWRRPIGLGWSSFAVVGGRAWTQEQVGDDERVTCLDVATGQTLWSHSERTRFSEWQGGDGPRATPTVQDGQVYAMGGTGILLCLDATTGKLVWRRSVLEDNGLSNLVWGTSSSPLIVDGLTVITGGRGSGAVLYAYRSSDGTP